MATQKQVGYIMALLAQKGYSTRFMDSSFKALGATMRERSGSVEAWVASLDVMRASLLIGKLKWDIPGACERPSIQEEQT